MGNQFVSKDHILKKSKRLFREKGYANTSISMLAAACEMSKSHFYYYFQNKEAIMESVLQQELAFFRDEIFQIAYEEAFSPKKRLKKIFKRLDNSVAKGNNGSIIAITVYQSTNGEGERFFPIIRKYYEEWESALMNIFTQKMSNKRSVAMTRSTILQIEGSLLFLMLNDDDRPFKETVNQLQNEFAKI